jgi:hypothetical protein
MVKKEVIDTGLERGETGLGGTRECDDRNEYGGGIRLENAADLHEAVQLADDVDDDEIRNLARDARDDLVGRNDLGHFDVRSFGELREQHRACRAGRDQQRLEARSGHENTREAHQRVKAIESACMCSLTPRPHVDRVASRLARAISTRAGYARHRVSRGMPEQSAASLETQ